MRDNDPYRHLDALYGCVGSWWFKGCLTPLFGVIALWVYIYFNGPP
jgi:hypothetical protein